MRQRSWGNVGSAPVGCRWPQPAATLRLVCFPHAGGGPAAFRSWAAALSPDVELWTATMAGRAGRKHEPFATDWRELTREFAAWVSAHVPPPVAIAGYSLGALVGFEVAREITRHGAIAIDHLLVCGHPAPESALSHEIPDVDDVLVSEVDRAFGGIPPEVRSSPEILRHFLPILRADLELASAYRLEPGPQLECAITAIAGKDDPAVSAAGLRRWSRYTSGSLQILRPAGGHFFRGEDERLFLDEVRRVVRA